MKPATPKNRSRGRTPDRAGTSGSEGLGEHLALRIFRAFEKWFNARFGWFFKNGMKQ